MLLSVVERVWGGGWGRGGGGGRGGNYISHILYIIYRFC